MTKQVPPLNTSQHSPSGWQLLFQWRTVALLLIVAGVTIMALYGLRSVRSYQEFQYIRAEGLDRGTARLDAIRAWMTVRYVAVAYAVPEEYIFAQLGIPYNRRNNRATLGQLNDEYALGGSAKGAYPAIIDQVAQAIQEYRTDPVPPGLRVVRPWMTVRYVSASTGVPETVLLEALGLDATRALELDARVRPLGELGPELRLRGGPEELFHRLEAAIEAYEASQP